MVVEAGTELDPPRPSAAVLVSPFDNLLWEFHSVRRVLGFEHVIELYKPAPQSKDSALVVKAFHLEPGVRHSSGLDDALDRALDRVRRIAGLERVTR